MRTIFQVGDKVKIAKEFSHRSFYEEGVFEIIKIIQIGSSLGAGALLKPDLNNDNVPINTFYLERANAISIFEDFYDVNI